MKVPLLLLLLLLGKDEPRVLPEPLGTFDPRHIPEASGIVRSRKRPDVFWVHNDSGNAPRLFAVGRDGRILRSYLVAAPNVDWEDVAVDDRGRLYLGDIGDNKGLLPVRNFYRLDEPDLDGPDPGPLRPTAAVFYGRTDGDYFDAEGFVVEGERAILVTKRLDGRDAELREVPLAPAPLFRPASARKIGTLPGFVDPATGADLSADGLRLAVSADKMVRVYERTAPASWDRLRLIAEVPLKGKLQVEGIAWDGEDLILASEHEGVARLAAATWKARPPRARKTDR